MTPLEKEVRIVIKEIYQAEYVGTLAIKPIMDNDTIIGYVLKLGLNKDERPLSIAFEGNKDQFVQYLKQELRTRRLAETDFYYGEKLYKNHEECCQQ